MKDIQRMKENTLTNQLSISQKDTNSTALLKNLFIYEPWVIKKERAWEWRRVDQDHQLEETGHSPDSPHLYSLLSQWWWAQWRGPILFQLQMVWLMSNYTTNRYEDQEIWLKKEHNYQIIMGRFQAWENQTKKEERDHIQWWEIHCSCNIEISFLS